MINVINLSFRKSQSSLNMGHVRMPHKVDAAALHQGSEPKKGERSVRGDCNFHFECSFLGHGTFSWMCQSVPQ